MGLSAGEARSTALRSSWAEICSGPKWKGISLHVNCTIGLARFAKCRINMRHTPMVPRKARTSERSLHGPHFEILSIYLWSGRQPCGVQWCQTMTISSVHKVDLNPLKVPPLYLMRCMMQLRFWKCSQTKHRMLEFLGMHSSVLSKRMYFSGGLQIVTSSMYGTVTLGISGCRMWVTSSWNIVMEFVQPIGRVTRHIVLYGVWNVVRLWEDSVIPCSS